MSNSFKIYNNYVRRVLDPKVKQKLEEMDEEQIENNFALSLEFGTAGMRGTMEMGTNNINELTVSKLAKSVSVYLQRNFTSPSVTICFDTRLNSKDFSRIFAKVLDNDGIKTYLFEDFAPTPLSVYSTVKLGATLGVMITASHNPKAYNGIKVYDSQGIQIDNVIQQEISTIFNKTDEIAAYNEIYNKELSSNVVMLDKSFEDEFVAGCASIGKKKLNLVYTPLNGTGYYCVEKLLRCNGFSFKTPQSQSMPSGHFETCPYPNPEFIEAFEESLKLAKEVNADLIVATDPDADRIGVVVYHDGEYVKLSGNDVGYILADYALAKNQNPNKFVVASVVTSPLIEDICKYHNAQLHKTLTGFMSLGLKAKELVKTYGKDAFALEYEESCGYVVSPRYYDKDGVFATLEICKIAEDLKSQGKTLIDYLHDIYNKTTYLCALGDSVKFGGANPKQNMQDKINSIRTNPLTEMAGYSIEKVVDYLYDDTGVGKQNFLEYYAGDLKFILRPSGTEPKLKIYLFLKGKDIKATEQKANQILEQVKQFIKE